MTRVVVQRGSASSSSSSPSSSSSSSSSSSFSTSSSNQNRASPTSSTSPSPLQHVSRIATVVPMNDGYVAEDQELIIIEESSEDSYVSDDKLKGKRNEDISLENLVSEDDCKHEKSVDGVKLHDNDDVGTPNDFGGSSFLLKEYDVVVRPSEMATGSSCPPPPPLPPPKPFSITASPRRLSPTGSNAVRSGPSRLSSGWAGMSNRSSPTGSHPSSPRSHSEAEGYNSADEQNPSFSSSYGDAAREHLFEAELRRVKGLEVRKMMEDGNCLFRAVADLVYGDSELYDLVRQMCIDYMERERDHFSQFVTEGFTSYCKRKRRDKVYGNNVEIQALSEMYNRPIHIYSYSTEPINIFHGSYNTDTPPIRLSYHHGNHYNSLVDPRRLEIGAGLGFNSLQGTNVDRDQVKAAIKAQQDQQIENALVAEGRFYSDLELTEKEIERMVLEDSRKEYLASSASKSNHQHVRESSSSQAEPSSSAARSSSESGESVASNISMQIMLSMGFSYLQAMEAYGIFGDDVDSMVSYLIETSNRRKGKATE